jgi:hypothetical protein
MGADPSHRILLGSEFPEIVHGAIGPRYPHAPNGPFALAIKQWASRWQSCSTQLLPDASALAAQASEPLSLYRSARRDPLIPYNAAR